MTTTQGASLPELAVGQPELGDAHEGDTLDSPSGSWDMLTSREHSLDVGNLGPGSETSTNPNNNGTLRSGSGADGGSSSSTHASSAAAEEPLDAPSHAAAPAPTNADPAPDLASDTAAVAGQAGGADAADSSEPSASSARKHAKKAGRRASCGPSYRKRRFGKKFRKALSLMLFALCVTMLSLTVFMCLGLRATPRGTMAQPANAIVTHLTARLEHEAAASAACRDHVRTQNLLIETLQSRLQSCPSSAFPVEQKAADSDASPEGVSAGAAASACRAREDPALAGSGAPARPKPGWRSRTRAQDAGPEEPERGRSLQRERALRSEGAAGHLAALQQQMQALQDTVANLTQVLALRDKELRDALRSERELLQAALAQRDAQLSESAQEAAAAGVRQAAEDKGPRGPPFLRSAYGSQGADERAEDVVAALPQQLKTWARTVFKRLSEVTVTQEHLLHDRVQDRHEAFVLALRQCSARVLLSEEPARVSGSKGAGGEWLDTAMLQPHEVPLVSHVHVRDVAKDDHFSFAGFMAGTQKMCRYDKLFAGLPLAEGLQSLLLQNGRLTDADAVALGAALERGGFRKLQVLSLKRNKVGDAGARQLALGLRSSGVQLRLLDVCHNLISDDGAQALAEALTLLPQLEEVQAKHNWLSRAGRKAFKATLRHIGRVKV